MEDGEIGQDDPPYAAVAPHEQLDALEQRRREAIDRIRQAQDLRRDMQAFQDERREHYEREERRRQLLLEVEQLESAADEQQRRERLARARELEAAEQDRLRRLDRARQLLLDLDGGEGEEGGAESLQDESGRPGLDEPDAMDEQSQLDSTRRALKRSAENGASDYLKRHWSTWSEAELRRDLSATEDYVERLPVGRTDESRTARGSLRVLTEARGEVIRAGCEILNQELMAPAEARSFITRLDTIVNSKSNFYFSKKIL